MSAGDKVTQAGIERNALSRLEELERLMRLVLNQDLKINRLDDITENLGTVTQGEWIIRDDDENIVMIISSTNLFAEYGVDTFMAYFDSSGTPSVWVDAATGLLTDPSGTVGTGNVVNNSTASNGNIVIFAGGTGLEITDSGYNLDTTLANFASSVDMYYLKSAASGIGAFKTLTQIYSALTSSATYNLDVSDGTITLAEFISDELGIPVIGSGGWRTEFYLRASATILSLVTVTVQVGIRTSGGVETNIVDTTTNGYALSTTPLKISGVGIVLNNTYLAETSRLYFRVKVSTTEVTPFDIYLDYGDTTYPAHVRLPISVANVGAGDMLKSMYDTNNREVDVFDEITRAMVQARQRSWMLS